MSQLVSDDHVHRTKYRKGTHFISPWDPKWLISVELLRLCPLLTMASPDPLTNYSLRLSSHGDATVCPDR